MPIQAANPTTLTATYNKWGMAYLHITGDGMADFGKSDVPAINLESALSKYRDRDNGDGTTTPERSPVPSDTTPPLRATLDELAAEPDLAPLALAAGQAIVTLLVAFATKRGAI
jgi:hypothetical protein